MSIRDITPYRALAVGAVGIIPIVYRLATGNEPPFPGNPSPTSYIPTNVFEQVTTGALFPATAGAIVGRHLLFGSERHSGFVEYLTYAMPAVLASLAWAGVGTLGRYAGIEGFERPGLIPFDMGVSATVSSLYAYLIDNTGRRERHS